LGQKAIKCIFLGYAQHSKGYRFLVVEPNLSVEVNNVIESRDAKFYEHRFTSIPSINDKMVEPIRNNNESGEPSEPSKIRSKRMRKEKSFGPNFIVYLVEGSRDSSCKQKMISLNIESDPLTYEEAMKSQDSGFWNEAINDEMDSIIGNNTWILVDLPPSFTPISCKWIFRRKLKVDGTIEKFKARFVAKGFKQKEGFDYFDTYALVARIATIRMLIALASAYKFDIHQMNVKTAFLNGELEE
jgi:hypothetical protein